MKPSDNRVVDLYCNQKLSIAQIAKKVNMSEGFVRKALKRKNIKSRSLSEGRKTLTGVTDEQILDLYNQGWAMRKISKHFRKSKNFAEYRLKNMGIEETRQIGFYNKQRTRLSNDEEKQLCKDYQDGMFISNIKKKYGFNGEANIYHILKKYNIKLKGGKNQDKWMNTAWKGGISALHIRIRQSPKGREWRQAVFERDHFTCMYTGEKNKKLNAHHKKRFSKIYEEFLLNYSHLDPIMDCDKLFELSQDYEEFWDIDNGVTLSEEVHKLING